MHHFIFLFFYWEMIFKIVFQVIHYRQCIMDMLVGSSLHTFVHLFLNFSNWNKTPWGLSHVLFSWLTLAHMLSSVLADPIAQGVAFLEVQTLPKWDDMCLYHRKRSDIAGCPPKSQGCLRNLFIMSMVPWLFIDPFHWGFLGELENCSLLFLIP